MRNSIIICIAAALALALPARSDKSAKEPILLEKGGKPGKHHEVFVLNDTLELSPSKQPKGLRALSDTALENRIKSSEAFRKYWAEVEAHSDLGALKKQLDARDIDKSWVPKLYLFDSTVVIWPVWMLLRGKK